MLRPLLLPLIIPFIAAAQPAGDPLRPDAEGVVQAVFNPQENLAEYGHWRSSKIGGGGYLLNVVTNDVNPDIVYTHSDVGGIFRSDDGGRNWRMLHNNVEPQSLDCVRDMLVDPQNPDIIIAAVGNQWTPMQGLYKSTDGGQSWKEVYHTQVFGNGPNRSMGRILQRSPDEPQTIYAAPGIEGVLVSRDDGETWESIGIDNLYVNDFKVDQTNAQYMFICASERKMSSRQAWGGATTKHELGGGLFRSDDGGQTWGKLSDEAPLEIIQSPMEPRRWYGIFNSMRVKYTNDAGGTWIDASEGLDLADSRPRPTDGNSYRAIGAGPDFLILANGQGKFFVKKSVNSPWVEVESERIQGDWFARSRPNSWDKFGRATASIVVDPNDENHWFFTDYYTVYQSWDAGKTWTLTIDGIENTVIHAVVQMPHDPSIVHMGMADNGYFRSDDGAASFQHTTGSFDNCKAIAVAPSDTDMVYLLAPKTHGWYADTVYMSSNAGKSFKRMAMGGVPKGKDDYRVNSIAVDSEDPYKLYIGVSGNVAPGQGGVWVSTDLGDTWSWDSEGLPQGKGFFQSSIWDAGYQLARNRNGSMVAIQNKAVYRRSSDAEPWQLADIQPSNGWSKFMQVFSSPSETGVYYVSEQGGGLYRSEDSGVTWRQVLDRGVESMAIDLNNSQRLAVSLHGNDGLLLSTDGGETWEALDNHIPQRHRLKLAFAGDRLVVGTPGNGVFYLPLSDKTLLQ
ncbi:WD40/YVTN/BNR-like repeat-containing protein [Cerasicoccus frondis]|uniref:WD40/YVTN/BNR-like repeat-containing protein n=1 Tax=Cerasicoccus frondis TaxID=490090 RepID=UPI0028528DBA|nr:hypothetical protein [Cerasicoccus frondis]